MSLTPSPVMSTSTGGTITPLFSELDITTTTRHREDTAGQDFLHFNVSQTTITQGHTGQSISTFQCFSHHNHPGTCWTKHFYVSMFLTPQSPSDMLDKAFLCFSPNSHPGTCWTKNIYASLFLTPQSHKDMLDKAFLHFNVSHTTITQGHAGQSISMFLTQQSPRDMLDKAYLHFIVSHTTITQGHAGESISTLQCFSHNNHTRTCWTKHFYTSMFFTPQSHKDMLDKAFLHFDVSHTTITQGHVGQSISTLQCFSHYSHQGHIWLSISTLQYFCTRTPKAVFLLQTLSKNL